MDQVFSILAGLSLLVGVLALLTGSLGLLRLPDVFSRIHAVGMIDTAGAGFIILGMLFYSGFTLVSFKLAAIGIFLFFTSPIATHAVAQVAHRNGLEPLVADSSGALVPGEPSGVNKATAKSKAKTTAKAKAPGKAKAKAKAAAKAKAKGAARS